MDRTLIDWDECDRLDTLFVLLCSVACWAVIPAIGMAYSGYSIRRNGLASIFPSLLALLVCTIQWYLIGYSLAFSEGNGFIGGLSKSFHIGVGAAPVGTIPEVLFSIFQLLFCATVCAISVGGSVERGRLLPLIPYIFLWCTFIYCPLAHMVWSEYGYLSKLGVMDFAGGTPVHICSGFSATAIAVYLSNPLFRSKKSSKRTPSHIKLHKPNNISNMLFSMVFIWNCWLPFESGTALAFNFKAVQAFAVTQFAAASGSLTWTALNYIETRKFSIDAAMLGMLSGLVMITPAGGFVSLTDALLLGFIGVVVIHTALRFKSTSKAEGMKWVDPADVAATHAFGGIFATLLVGVFGQKKIAAYDGTEILGGVLHDGHWDQLRIQLVEGLIGATLSFVLSYVFIAAIDCVPGLEVLCTDEELLDGMDASQCLESLYGEHAKDEEDYQPISVQAVRLD